MNFGLRELFFVLVLLAMPLSSYWFVFRAQNEEITQAKKEIEQKELMLNKLARATSQTADLERANREMAEGIQRIESRLPNNKEVDVILDQVAALARESKLELPRIKALKPLKSATYMEQPLEMSVSGDFDDFYNFLLRLEQLDRITRVPDMTIERSKDEDGSMEARFTLSIYFQPETKGAL